MSGKTKMELLSEFDKVISELDGIREWLNLVIDDRRIVSLANRPSLTMLLTGCAFVKDNLVDLKNNKVKTLIEE